MATRVGSRTTVVVAPRESFSRSIACLGSIFAHTPPPFELIMVDAGSPPGVARRLERCAADLGFALLRSPHFLSPNEARNAGFARVETEYTVFVGNDVLVTDGWLEPLVDCADATGAAFVGGVSCWRASDAPVVYCAGGETHLVTRDDGSRGLHDVHHHANTPLADVVAKLRRAPSEAAVFHCMLARSDVIDRLGGMDENITVLDHVDWCLRAQREANGGWFEPDSAVRYSPPSPLRPCDVPYNLLRWSKTWIESSCAHFCNKWNVDPDDAGLGANVRWVENHRWHPPGRLGAGAVDALVTNTLVRRYARRRARGLPAAELVSARGRSTP